MNTFEFLKEHVDPTDEKFNTDYWFPLFKAQYKVKSAICAQQNPRTILEIGVRAGYSALAFLTVCPSAHYVGIDSYKIPQGKEFMDWANYLLQDYDAQIWNFNTRPLTKINLQDVDFCHIDGNHHYEYVLHDLDLCFELLSEHGSILLDDMVIEEVYRATRDWLELHEKEVNYEYVLSRTGEMIIRKAGNHTRYYETK